MDHVLTLICSGTSAQDMILPQVKQAIKAAGGQSGEPVVLGETAFDLPFMGLSPQQVEHRVREVLAGETVDLLAQPLENRRKKLLVADMDATMVTGETLDELAERAGIKDRIAAITARAMNGELDFAEALHERIGLLRGLPKAALEQTWQAIAFTGGAKTLVQTMRADGAYCVLVSGGFKFFTDRVRDCCGFHEDRANDFIFDANDSLIGVQEPILGRQAKLDALNECATRLGLTMAQCLAVGDGANDLDMIRAAGLGIAFHAKPTVAVEARARVDYGDLTSLLYFQGYKQDEWVD